MNMNKNIINPLSAAAVLGGAGLVKSQIDGGNLTGRERLYHNTNKKNLKNIKHKGIIASKALDEKNLTHASSGDFLTSDDIKGLTYAGRKYSPSFGVAVSSALKDSNNKDSVNHKDLIRALADRKTVHINAPVWKMETTDNPELQGAKNSKELGNILQDRWKKRVDKKYGDSVTSNILLKPGTSLSAKLSRDIVYDQLGPNGTYVFKGSLSPKYIKESPRYKGLTKEEVKDYINNNPLRFTKGSLISAAGAGLTTKGVYDILKNVKKASPDALYEIEKQAGINPKLIAKGALGAMLMANSGDLLSGKKTVYHGTSKDNWESIKKNGINPNKGGKGVSSINKNLKNNSKNNVYVTAVKPIANYHAAMSGRPDKFSTTAERLNLIKEKQRLEKIKNPSKKTLAKMDELEKAQRSMYLAGKKEYVRGHFINPGENTKVMKIKMNYNKFKDMSVDNDLPINRDLNNIFGADQATGLKKQFAAKGPFDINTKEIKDTDATKRERFEEIKSNLPNYIKKNPIRFGAGVGGTALGAKLLSDALRGVK